LYYFCGAAVGRLKAIGQGVKAAGHGAWLPWRYIITVVFWPLCQTDWLRKAVPICYRSTL